MTLRRLFPVSLLAALAVGPGLERGGGKPPCADSLGKSPVPPPVNMARAAAVANPRGNDTLAAARANEPALPVGGLNADESATLAEQVALRQLLHEADLDLASAEWVTLAAVASHYQTVRQTFEATIATVAGERGLRLEVPAYPAAGDALREKFYDELRERMGDATAALIAARAGSALEGYFGGFGVSVQTLEFAPSPGATGMEFQVTRTAHYWNSAVPGRSTLTLRRETHFAASEDRDGERWGPFLARLPASSGARSGS